MLCEMGALRSLCMELSFLKNLFTATVICRSELMFIYSSSCQKKKKKMHNCTFFGSLERPFK